MFLVINLVHNNNLDQWEMVSYLCQVITLSDLEENQLSTQPTTFSVKYKSHINIQVPLKTSYKFKNLFK